MEKTDIFTQNTTSSAGMSAGLYNFAIGATLLWGFIVNWYMIQTFDPAIFTAMPTWAFLVAFFVTGIAGVALFTASSNPLVSFIGYNLVVVAFGVVLNIVVSQYDPELVLQAIQTTALVTAVMMFAATCFPGFFKRIAGALFVALLAMIVVELVQVFVFNVQQGWTDWVVAAIFCGYIGVDWVRANECPRTLDNAIDGAASLYMDIINLFIRILKIYADNK